MDDTQADPPEPEWKSFERAVAAFLQRLEPGARVDWNTRRPDAHTGHPRQRDVWIHARVAGFPVRIFVSCKDYARKINELDVDHFLGEFGSTDAHVGVLYSSGGFTPEAIEKGQATGVSCCRLYQSEPPDVPEALVFTTYLWRSRAQITVVEGLHRHQGITWRDLFECADKDGTLLDQLVSACGNAAERAREPATMRPDMLSIVNLAFENIPALGTFKVRVTHAWRLFRAKASSHSLSGSYSATEAAFLGSIQSPAIDTWSADPGAGWEQVPPAQESILPNAVHIVLPVVSARPALIEDLGPRTVHASQPSNSDAQTSRE